MSDYTAEQYREASQGYVGPNKITQIDNKESAFSQFTTRELEIEIERRKKSIKDTFCKLADDMYSRGFTYTEIKEILDNI